MYALVEIKGKQYRAEKDALLKVDRFEQEPGAPVEFDSVLCTVSGDAVKVGKPYVTGVTVKATVEGHEKGDKVRVYKYKRRKSYRRTRGHRQQYTLLRVSEISGL
mgnify:CR=1 FL=1